MRLFDEHVILRFSLLIASFLFSAFLPEIVDFTENPVNLLPYVLCTIFLVYLAFFYRFPVSRMHKKLRSDIKIEEIKPKPIRDFQKDLMEKDELFQMMIDVSSEGFWTFDVPTGKVYWSSKVAKMLGVSSLEDSFDLLKNSILESDWEKFKKTLQKSMDEHENFSVQVRLLDNVKNKEILITGRPQCNESGLPIRVVGSMGVVSDNGKLERENDFLTTCDSLTGTRNRQEFLNELAKDVDRATIRSDYIFAVILLDIDNFSAINDSYTTKCGDQVLRIIADRISASCFPDDCVARIGPDVFGLVFRDIQNGDDADEITSRVRALHSKVKKPLKVDGRELCISVSMAVVVNKDGECVEDLLANANAILRDMKCNGNHGGIQFFTGGIREKAMRLYKLEFEIRRAIQAREFILMYQPIVDISAKNSIVGFEALVRWNNTERGVVSPSEFIPIAEQTGLIIPMGAQILRMACEQTKKWVDMGFTDIKVSVNFSAKQFALDNMVDDVKRVLQETHLNPRNLKLEITEYTALSETEKTIEIMRSLSSMGLQISIDDFGTGYSSLSYLKQFPVHTLKMDKSFVDHVTEDEEDASFARMVIGIARSLNLGLIAEGVETKDQLEFLRHEGCKQIQGYYFSKPLTTDEALMYMRNHYVQMTG